MSSMGDHPFSVYAKIRTNWLPPLPVRKCTFFTPPTAYVFFTHPGVLKKSLYLVHRDNHLLQSPVVWQTSYISPTVVLLRIQQRFLTCGPRTTSGLRPSAWWFAGKA